MKKQIRKQLRLIAEKLLNEENELSTGQIKNEVLHLYNQLVMLEYFEKTIAGEDAISSISDNDSAFLDEETITADSHEEVVFEISDLNENSEKAEIQNYPSEIQDNSESSIETSEEEREEESSTSVQQYAEEEVEENPFEKAETEDETIISEQPVAESLPLEEENPFEETHAEDSEKVTATENNDVQEQEKSPDEEPVEEPKYSPPVYQNELELFAASYQRMPEFERKSDAESRHSQSPVSESSFDPFEKFQSRERTSSKEDSAGRPKSLNDVLNRGLNIGLNDRLAFIKHLFEGRSEDYARVLSQLETFGTLEEATDFIRYTVKPDYNQWNTKEEYEIRFMTIVEKKFGV